MHRLPRVDAASTLPKPHVQDPGAVPFPGQVRPAAGPGIILGRPRQQGAHGILLDVAQCDPQALPRKRTREVSILPDVSTALAASVESLGVTAMNAAKQSRERV